MNTNTEGPLIGQTDYDDYPKILFQIDALRQLFNKTPNLLENITLNDFYCELLIKKYYLDVDIFKSYCPKASRDIDTISELNKALKSRNTDNENADTDKVGLKIKTVLAAQKTSDSQHSTSPIDSTRDVLIDLNSFRLNYLWERTMLSMMSPFSSVMHPADVANGFSSVGFYVINVIATLCQAFAHKNDASNAYNIKTSEIKFLELHTAKFMNDLVWAPINSFYFINLFVASCRHNPSIGDSFALVGFIFDFYMGVQEYNQIQAQYDELIKKLEETLKQDGNNSIIDELGEQQTNKLWELQKNLSGLMFQTLAMLTLLVVENLDNSAFNLLLIAPIIAVSAKLILITYNFCERWNKAANLNEKSFAITEFSVKMGQQMVFFGAIIIVALVVMPHITAPTLLIMYLLMSSCLMFSYLINQLSNKIIDSHSSNPDKLIEYTHLYQEAKKKNDDDDDDVEDEGEGETLHLKN